MTIKPLLLKSVSEGMILAQDVIDKFGRLLIPAGIPLKQEIINLLEKHEITSIVVQDHEYENLEIYMLQDIISSEAHLRLLCSVQRAFSMANGLEEHFLELQSYIEDIVTNVTKRNHVLLYLNELTHTSDYLYMHSVNVCVFSILIGIAMKLPHDELCLLGMGGLLHDFGKTKISPEILNKQGTLTITEFNEIKEHASIGYNLLRIDVQLDYRIMFMALQHHERCNGSGYPWGISKSKIHPLARIVAVADVYDALTTDRVYRSRLSSYTAIQMINEGDGIHFDPQVIEAFNKIAIPYPIDSFVALSNGRVGQVVGLNSSNLFRPFIVTEDGMMNLLSQHEMNILIAK